MKSLVEKGGVKDDESDENGGGGELLCDSVEEECEESSSSFETLSTEEKQCNGNCDCHELMGSASVSVSKDEKAHVEDEKPKASVSDIDMMKERFSKLLLGEDMSGSGQGACTALAISNAITNLSATIFGQLWRLEPLRIDKKSMWQREMEWLLCVSDHIVEFKPSWQTFPNRSKLEVMTCRQRSDLNINIPALRKLDNMLLEILDSFHDSDFWYVDKGISGSDSDGSTSSRKSTQRQEDKWWLPLPHVPHGGLQESSRKKLQDKRECTNQILKAAVAINSNSLAEMAVPQSYIDSLPKYGRESLGDVMYRYITSDKFSPDHILDRLQFSSEHQVLEIANRVEASIYVWRQITQRTIPKPPRGTTRDKTVSTEKRVLFADRAEGLLMCLKNRFPGLPQTSLDTSKIQFNKDVGKSILESYSRVLESLAFNIVARIDDILYIDDLAKQSEVPPFSSVAKKGALIAYSNNNINRSSLPSPSRGSVREDRYPLTIRTASARSLTVKKVLNDYLS